MKRWFLLVLVFLTILSCQLFPTPPPIQPTSIAWITPSIRAQKLETPQKAIQTAEATDAIQLRITPSVTSLPFTSKNTPSSPRELPTFLPSVSQPFSSIQEIEWHPTALSEFANFSLPIPLEKVTNREVLAGLTSRQKSFLEENGFVVLHSQEAQFGEIRDRVSLQFGQPYYLTTDAAYHALSLALDELIIALEREEIMQSMIAITKAMMEQVNSYLPSVSGTNLENDTRLAAAYLGVALRLLDAQTVLEPSSQEITTDQIDQILAGNGLEESVLIPHYVDDFSTYTPTGHYAGDPALEGYFRAMTWFKRVHFDFQDNTPGFVPSRVPLILTMALRQGVTPDGSAAQEWSKIQELFEFLIGPSYDLGPADYSEIMDQIYGRKISISNLTNETLWQNFQTLSPVLPSMHNRSVFDRQLEELEFWQGWRLMGRRFNLDDLILLNLVYDRVGTLNTTREIPSNLDILATFNSATAFQVLDNSGVTSFVNYLDQLDAMQNEVNGFSNIEWHENTFNSLVYAITPQLDTKDAQYPSYMRTVSWSHKNLNSALGGWADYKHDSSPSFQIQETISDDNPGSINPPPGYVEPEPLVFYRLAYLANAIAEGMNKRGVKGVFSTNPMSLNNLLLEMLDLGDRFQRLGDIAIKELEGSPLDLSDLRLIHAALGPTEERAWINRENNVDGTPGSYGLPPIEGILAWEGSGNRILQYGTGAVDRIYVIFPQDGQLQIAQGGVYSYYEFPQPRSWKLSDEGWRQMLKLSPPDRPSWVEKFSLPGGTFVDVLSFRIGEKYQISQAISNVNMYEAPSRNSPISLKLQSGDTIIISDGPVESDGLIWWKFKLDIQEGETVEGWATQNQDWYKRVW